jgi:hypothetical protein
MKRILLIVVVAATLCGCVHSRAVLSASTVVDGVDCQFAWEVK